MREPSTVPWTRSLPQRSGRPIRLRASAVQTSTHSGPPPAGEEGLGQRRRERCASNLTVRQKRLAGIAKLQHASSEPDSCGSAPWSCLPHCRYPNSLHTLHLFLVQKIYGPFMGQKNCVFQTLPPHNRNRSFGVCATANIQCAPKRPDVAANQTMNRHLDSTDSGNRFAVAARAGNERVLYRVSLLRKFRPAQPALADMERFTYGNLSDQRGAADIAGGFLCCLRDALAMEIDAMPKPRKPSIRGGEGQHGTRTAQQPQTTRLPRFPPSTHAPNGP